MKLTPVGKILALLCVLFYWGILQTHSGLLFLVLGIMMGCFLIDALVAFQQTRRISLDEIFNVLVEEGGVSTIPVVVNNSSGRDISALKIWAPWGGCFEVRNLPSGKSRRVVVSRGFIRRGIYSLDRLRVEVTSLLGLVRCRFKAAVKGRIVVYPRIHACPPPTASGSRPVIGGKAGSLASSAFGSSLHGIRPLQPGDSSNRIHWPASAKGQGLMVKEFASEMAGHVSILLGTYPFSHGNGSDSLLNAACRMAASLAVSAMNEKHFVHLIVIGQEKWVSVPPFSDEMDLMRKLAGVSSQDYGLFSHAVSQAIHKLPRFSSLIFILLEMQAEVMRYISNLAGSRKEISVYLPADRLKTVSQDETKISFLPFALQSFLEK